MTFLKNVFLVTIISIATLKIADFSFGLVQPVEFLLNGDQTKNRSIVLKEFNPNQSVTVTPDEQFISNAELSEQTLDKLQIDSNGFIDNGNPYELNPELRIIFFGGSSTENLYVQTENRFPSVVERSMRKQLEQNIVTHNGGVSGNNSMHSNLAFIAKGIPLKPNFVVLMHNVNDLAVLSKTESYWIAPNSRALVLGNAESTFAVKNSPRLSIYFLLRGFKDIIVPNLYAYLQPRLTPYVLALRPDEFDGFRGKSPIDFERAEMQFRSSLISFTQVTRAWGIEPILMTQSNRMNIDDLAFKSLLSTSPNLGMSPEQFIAIYKRFNNITRMVARDQNVSLIDLDNLIPGSSKHLYDTVHFNNEGNRLAGEIISEHLVNILSKDSQISIRALNQGN